MRTLITTLLSLVVLSACGGGEEPKGPIEKLVENADEWPACDDVWVVGETLPKDYEGCTSDEGIVPADPYWECADGTRLTFVDKPAAFARIGGEVRAGSNQGDAFAAEFDRCEPA